jgi:hypothetical protein
MNYYVYALNETFSSDNIYHMINTTSPKRAACQFASNEENLYGMCDSEYNVYDPSGKLISKVNVDDLNSISEKATSIPEYVPWSSDNTLSNFGSSDAGIDCEGLHLEGGQFTDLGTFEGTQIIGVSPTNCDDITDKFNKSGIGFLDMLSNIVKPNLDRNDNMYNPIIAREFIKESNFAEAFTKKYGFFIAESKEGLFGSKENNIEVVFTGPHKESSWPDSFTDAEYDQLHNITAVLLACGISFYESSENVWILSSKRWSNIEIATITKQVMIKCKLRYTGYDSNQESSMIEYKGKWDLPRQLDFLN